MAIAHSRDQLATLLPTMPWFSQLPQDVVDRFLSSIKYVEQKLAHMEHGQIRQILNDHEFKAFLTLVGTNEEKFAAFDGRFCDLTPDNFHCAVGNGYCDPGSCHL
jgi:hypothetical protein